ncbi:MAG: VWA domain-containing protein [Candidatus Lokiarchaeota archaeon]|nr:VWA domain-containing protein [Candidatus Lokiarchaeota archaeon]
MDVIVDSDQKPENQQKPKVNAPHSVEIVVVADRSGSMETMRDDAIGGFNAFLESQKKLSGKAVMTYVQFDHQYNLCFTGKLLKDVDPLDRTTFVPRGQTALIDAVGRTINEVEERIAKADPADKPDAVVIVVLTDGKDNASVEFKLSRVKQLIEKKTKDGWDFTFLSADMDAVSTGQSLGFARQNVALYCESGQGTQSAFHSFSSRVADVRCGSAIKTSDEYLKQAEKEIKSSSESKRLK